MNFSSDFWTTAERRRSSEKRNRTSSIGYILTFTTLVDRSYSNEDERSTNEIFQKDQIQSRREHRYGVELWLFFIELEKEENVPSMFEGEIPQRKWVITSTGCEAMDSLLSIEERDSTISLFHCWANSTTNIHQRDASTSKLTTIVNSSWELKSYPFR